MSHICIGVYIVNWSMGTVYCTICTFGKVFTTMKIIVYFYGGIYLWRQSWNHLGIMETQLKHGPQSRWFCSSEKFFLRFLKPLRSYIRTFHIFCLFTVGFCFWIIVLRDCSISNGEFYTLSYVKTAIYSIVNMLGIFLYKSMLDAWCVKLNCEIKNKNIVGKKTREKARLWIFLLHILFQDNVFVRYFNCLSPRSWTNLFTKKCTILF